MDNTNRTLIQTPEKNLQLRKDIINRIRQGSPRLKEALRQKFQQRIQNKRYEAVNNRRFGLIKTDNPTENEIMLTSGAGHINLMDSTDEGSSNDVSSDSLEELLNIEREFLEKQEQLAMNEYDCIQEFEKFLDELSSIPEGPNQKNVLCPMCQKSLMFEGPGSIICSGCQFTLPLKMSLDNFHDSLKSQAFLHSTSCNNTPAFITLPESDTIFLYLTCDACLSCLLIM